MPERNSDMRESLKAAAPIMPSYAVLGILCVAAVMEPWMTAAMSLLFYSGAGST